MLTYDFMQISGLGRSKTKQNVDYGLNYFPPQIIGTMGYRAPEVLIIGKSSTKSDIYSFGIVILELIRSHPVEDGTNYKDKRLVKWVSV